MSATLSHEQPTPTGLAAVPKAMWAVLGTLALATAGLAGALVMKSTQKDPVPVAAVQPAPPAVPSAQFAQQAMAEKVIPQAPADMPEAGPAPAPKAKAPPPPKVAKPAPPKPQPQVQQATGSATAPAPAGQGGGTGTQVAQAPVSQPVVVQPAPVCHTCGTVQHVQEVKVKAEQGSGVGAVGGAVVGGLLGNQVGSGNGRAAMTVLGAVGGGLAGNEIEKRVVRPATVYDVQVRMEDGSVRTVRSAQPVAAGTRVVVEGNQLRIGSPSAAQPAVVQPGTMRTSG